MTITWITPGMDDLPLDLDNGFRVRTFDVGSPQPRAVTSNRPLADGTTDTTAYVGPRVVSIDLLLTASATATRLENRDALARRCHPQLRSVLRFDAGLLCDETAERRILVRGDVVSAPVSNPTATEVQVTLVGYTGLVEAAEPSEETVPPLPAAEGELFPWEFPVVFPAAAPVPTVVTSAGSMGAWPTIRVDGPCEAPVIGCGDRVLAFPGLTIEAGHFLLIDTSARTVLLDGVTDRRGALDLSVSSWWQLAPGDNDLLFTPARSGPPALVTVTWRDTYFL